ncbi:MAG: hypothetical protein U0T32_09975 [Chitinophagales bacterium]
MKKQQLLLLFALFSITWLSSCKKDPDPTSSGYYIKYNLDGKSYYNKSQVFQAGCNDSYELGGWCNSEKNFYDAAGITIVFNNKITKSDVLTLAGKTFYFDGTSTGTLPIGGIIFKHNIGMSYVYSYSTTDHSYFVKINSVTFVENNGMFNIYKVTGTFKAKMEYDSSSPSVFKDATSGDFNMMWSSFN